jgi:hypothetical protein
MTNTTQGLINFNAEVTAQQKCFNGQRKLYVFKYKKNLQKISLK